MTTDIPGYTEDQAADFFAEHVRLAAEDLHPDLEPYTEDNDSLGTVLRHPLVYQVPLLTNGHANQMYEHKLRQLERAIAENDYSSLVYLHERPYRLNAFIEFVEQDAPDEIYWEVLGNVWTDTENMWQNKREWKRLLTSTRPDRIKMMREDDVVLFEALPDTVIIYRGCSTQNENGMSWTLSKEKALWFANRFRTDGYVLEAEVKKSDIIALLNHRGEQEIICYKTPNWKIS